VLEEAKQDDRVPALPGGSEVSKEESLARFVGESESVVWMKSFVEKVAPLDKSVLITGASGVGKTLVAEIIHSLSGRSGKPLVKVNCASIPEGDFELALFGAKKDLSKGVEKDLPGKIEKARGGTLLFNKICEMPLKVQGRLVSFFESKEVEKPRLEEAISADVRILATARTNLQDRISQGAFREDLYFGVNVMSIHVPPLIDRMKDLPELIRHLMGRINPSLGTNISSISDSVLGILSSHDWPGNVRELQNVLERAAILSDGAVIKEQDARTAMREAVGLRAATAGPENAATMKKKRVSLKESLNKLEKDLILEALSKTRGIQVEAAEMLGLKPKNLWKKIQKHSIKFLRSEPSRAQKGR
jgi:two-component system response regulator AtoC